MKLKFILALLTLMLCCMSVFCIRALAVTGTEHFDLQASWVDSDTLHIVVRELESDISSVIELRVSDFSDDSKTTTVRAVDADGNMSADITITNPYYNVPVSEPDTSESAIPDGWKPFTPNGTSDVLDNAAEQDGKEFFTITTENENTFFLVVDRQKTGGNVYLLNAVTENDLMALAVKSDGRHDAGPAAAQSAGSKGVIPDSSSNPPKEAQEPEAPPLKSEQKDSGGSNSLFIIIPAVIAVGGVGYYIKIIKPKQQVSDDYENESDYEDEQDEPEEETEDIV